MNEKEVVRSLAGSVCTNYSNARTATSATAQYDAGITLHAITERLDDTTKHTFSMP